MVQSCLRLAKMAEHDRLIYFSFITAFMGCALFSWLDVTLFDVRLNAIGWLLLAAIWGTCQDRSQPTRSKQ